MTGNSGLYPPAEDPVNEEWTGLIKHAAVMPFQLLSWQLPYHLQEVGVAGTTAHQTVDHVGWRWPVLHHIRVDVVLLCQHARVAQNNRVQGAYTLHVKVSVQPPVGVQHKVPCTNTHSMSRSAYSPPWVYNTKYLVQTHTPCQGQHTAPPWVYNTKYLVQTHTPCQGQRTAPRGCTTQSTLYKHTLHVKVSIQSPVCIQHKVPCTNTHSMSRSAYSPPWVYNTKYLVQTHTPCQGQRTAPRGCTTQSTLYKHTLHVKVSIQPPVGVQHKVPCTNTHSMSRSAYSSYQHTAYSTKYFKNMLTDIRSNQLMILKTFSNVLNSVNKHLKHM